MSIIIAFDSRNYAIKSMCANRWCRFQVKTIFAFISENVICLFGMTNGSFETQTERGMFIGKVTTKAEIATINHFACLWLFGNAVFVTHSVVCLPLEFLWRLTQNSAATQSYRSSEFSQNDQTYQNQICKSITMFFGPFSLVCLVLQKSLQFAQSPKIYVWKFVQWA